MDRTGTMHRASPACARSRLSSTALALPQDLQGPKIRIERNSTPDFAEQGTTVPAPTWTDGQRLARRRWTRCTAHRVLLAFDDVLPDMDVLLDDGRSRSARSRSSTRAYAARSWTVVR